MTVALSVSIMHAAFDAERRAMLISLMRTLGGAATLNEETVGWSITKDGSRDGVWPTARRAWLDGLRYRATHHLVLQDDIVVCRDFLRSAKVALEARPDAPVSFFDLSRAIPDALAKGSHWAVRRSLSMGQAVAMPVEMIAPAVQWVTLNTRPEAPTYDARFAAYFLTHRIEVWHTAPSLVEHVDGGHSLLNHPDRLPTGKRRVASKFIGIDTSGCQVDWSRGIDKPHRGWSHALKDYASILTKGA